MRTKKLLELLLLLKPRKENNKFTVFHILGQSIWPILVAISLLSLALSGVIYMSGRSGIIPIIIAITILIYYLIQWWGDVAQESGEHTESIKENIKLGMVLFIISEIMFFSGFFGSYIYLSRLKSINLGEKWPSCGMQELIMDPYGIPLLNTIILLGSGILITYVHLTMTYYIEKTREIKGLQMPKNTIIDLEKEIKERMWKKFILSNVIYSSRRVFLITVIFAILFTLLQLYEYIEASFNISDSVFGSLFYMMTGFHGFHVIIGTIFLVTNLIRDIYINITYSKESVGLECAIWYWHFVDVVWICLYILLYWLPFEVCEAETPPKYASLFVWWVAHFPLITLGEVVGIAHSGQLGFQESASTTMDSIVFLHNYINLYLTVILCIVIIIMYRIILHNILIQTIYTKRRRRLNFILKLNIIYSLNFIYIRLYARRNFKDKLSAIFSKKYFRQIKI